MAIRIAVLNADVPVPKVLAARGRYSDIFETLLRSAAVSMPEWTNINLEFVAYDVMLGELPLEDELRNLNGIVITGSASSAYDQKPWVMALNDLLYHTYHNHPHVALFGSCFGHQIICQALLSPSPTQSCVSQDPKGWELGIHAISLTPSFLSRFGPVISNQTPSGLASDQLRLQFVHHDHVVIPTLPEGWTSIGRSDHCALQGVYQPGRVLTYQGHAEFDTFVNGETMRVFGPLVGWNEEAIEKAVRSVDGDDDARWAASVVMRFFGEASEERNLNGDIVVADTCGIEAQEDIREDEMVQVVLQRV